ncbi:hypothetical protein B005_1448 [Nocardiopsis alba ATCC BAA-2165]|uniref:Uncharacterized protein n=1 Tax=Nocardiopsis alba (strain ATCC BAA-2165 / BE74) TaxID=1205910 RepID=J7LGM9_NOCAA|nr:hypothetical protein B005_1448 [Nocardiopsis alba ATCC BAA-2165]
MLKRLDREPLAAMRTRTLYQFPFDRHPGAARGERGGRPGPDRPGVEEGRDAGVER